MADRVRVAIPWLLVAGSAILVVVILYVIFVACLPVKQRLALLEAELKQLYLREAALQTKLVQQEHQAALREKAILAERDGLARRLDNLRRPEDMGGLEEPPKPPGRSVAPRRSRGAPR